MGLFDKKKKEVDLGKIAFATYVPDGRKPDAEIHIVGFERGCGLETTEKYEGKGIYLTGALSLAVRAWLDRLRKDGWAEAMSAASMVMHRIIEALGEEDAKKAWEVAVDVNNGLAESLPNVITMQLKPEDGRELVELLEQAKAEGLEEAPPELLEKLKGLLGGREE